MVVVGLTGGLATGKSTVAKMFAALGAKVIDADKLAHRLLWKNSPCFKKIVTAFGKKILTAGRISRRKLAKEVFSEEGNIRKLEEIIHPAVTKQIVSHIKKYTAGRKRGLVVLDVPLLFEVGLNKYADAVVVVKAKESQQLERAVKRLGIWEYEAKERIKNQMPLKEKIRQADFVIDNSGTKNTTKLQVRKTCQKLQQMEKE